MATGCRLERESDGAARLSGELTFESVPAFFRDQASRFGSSDDVSTLDLSGLGAVDSAGLALLLEWQARRGEGKQRLAIVNAPASLLSLARLCEADEVLDIRGRGAVV